MEEVKRKKILFVINPISGVVKKNHIPERIQAHIDYVQYDYEIRYTQYPGHATEIAKQAVEEGFDAVAAVGGDGSINEVATGLLNTDVALGIIPFGSGNGLALHLGIKARDVEKALDVMNNGKVVKLDGVLTNNGLFMSNGGFGLDAASARRFKHQSWRGLLSYMYAGFSEVLWHFSPSQARIKIDDVEIEGEFYLFTAFNSNQFGYDLGVFPNTSLKDGVLDVVAIRPFPLYKLPYIIMCLMLKRVDLIKEASTFRAKHIEIYSNAKQVYQFDGDHFISHEPLIMDIAPQVLNVIVPESLKSY